MKENEQNTNRKNQKFEKFLIVGIGVILGLLTMEISDKIINEMYANEHNLYMRYACYLGVLIFYYIALVLHIFIHEIGHLIFGLLTGYKFCSIRFFNIMFIKINGKVRIKKFSLKGTAGQCLMIPPRCDGTSPVILYNWGGCILNAVFSSVSMALAFFFWNIPFARVAFIIFGLIGFVLGLNNGIPLKSISNDGYNAIIADENHNVRVALERMLLVHSRLAVGDRLKDMPREWFNYEIGKIPLENNHIIALAIDTMCYYMDCHEFEKAYELAEYFYNNVSMIDSHRATVIAELLYLILITDKDATRIEEILDDEARKLLRRLDGRPGMNRVWYTYELLYNGDEVEANEYSKLFEKIAKKFPYEGDISSEREFMELAFDKCLENYNLNT